MTHVIMNVDRPNGSGGIYKAGVEYDLADDLAALWRGMGICRLTTVRSEQTGAAVSATTGNFPDAPAMNKRIPVEAVPSGSGMDLRGIAPSGTVAADGTITLGTALPATFAQIMLYLPAGAISGGSAGFYSIEMSSTTVGVVRERFGGAALVGSGSAYTGVTTEVTAYSWPIKAGELSKRRIESALIHPNNSNVKSFRLRFGTAQCALASGASNTSSVINAYINRIQAGVQITTNAGATGASGVMAITTVDDSTEQSLSITMQLATATDYCIAVLCNQLTGM